MSAEVLTKGPIDASVQSLAQTTPEFYSVLAQHVLERSLQGTTNDGKPFDLQLKGDDGLTAIVSITDRDNDTSYKMRAMKTGFVLPSLGRDFGFWRSVFTNKPQNLGIKLERRHTFIYENGRKVKEGDVAQYIPAVRTDVDVTKIDDDYKIAGFHQGAFLTNPNAGLPKLELFARLGIVDDSMALLLGFGITSKYKGEEIVTTFERAFARPDEERTYRSRDVMGAIVEKMPARLSVMSVEESERARLGRVQMARLSRTMPKELTGEQMDQLVINVLEGRIATTGIWNPLEALPELRKASKPHKAVKV